MTSKKKPIGTSIKSRTGSKVIRDSFSMVEGDYELIFNLKRRCLDLGVNVNKSQILRAGLNSLNKMTDSKLLRSIKDLKEVKTGRPTGRP